jgi:hypothetical protein
MPILLTEFEWKAVLLVYKELATTRIPLSEAAQPLRRLASQLQLINDPDAADPGRKFRTAKGLAYQSKSFHILDPSTPYTYTHNRRVVDLARQVWEAGGILETFSDSFSHELKDRLSQAQNASSLRVLQAPVEAEAVVYLLQHRDHREFVKVVFTTRTPDQRAAEYSDGRWAVVGEFRTSGTNDAREKERLIHQMMMDAGLWIPPEIVGGSAREVFMCGLGEALAIVGEQLEHGER